MTVCSFAKDYKVFFLVLVTCLIRVSNSTPFLATNPAVLSTMFFTSGGGWMIGISASATIFTPEMFQQVTKLFSRNYNHELTGVNTGKHLFLQEALQRLPNAEACGTQSGTERNNGRAQGQGTKTRGADSRQRRPLPAVYLFTVHILPTNALQWRNTLWQCLIKIIL